MHIVCIFLFTVRCIWSLPEAVAVFVLIVSVGTRVCVNAFPEAFNVRTLSTLALYITLKSYFTVTDSHPSVAEKSYEINIEQPVLFTCIRICETLIHKRIF